MRFLAISLLLAACAAPAPVAVAPPEQPVALIVSQAPVPRAPSVPTSLTTALAKATPREAAAVSSPSADADSVALVRLLDGNVRKSLAEVERHPTPENVARAKTAVRDLQNHLDELGVPK